MTNPDLNSDSKLQMQRMREYWGRYTLDTNETPTSEEKSLPLHKFRRWLTVGIGGAIVITTIAVGSYLAIELMATGDQITTEPQKTDIKFGCIVAFNGNRQNCDP